MNPIKEFFLDKMNIANKVSGSVFKWKYWLLYLSVFTLPMFMRLNNILLFAFILLGTLEIIMNHKKYLANHFLRAWPVWTFFVLAILGSFYGSEDIGIGFKNLERYWSFFLVPFVFVHGMVQYETKREQIFMSLVLGCVVTLLICYGNVVYEMIVGNEPLDYFFRWRHIGHQFTEIADTHPTYLGIFIVTSVLFMIQDKRINAKLKYPIMVFLIFGLFQLASRMALLLIVVFILYFFLLYLKKYKAQIALLILGLIACSLLFNKLGSDYMKSRLFSKESIADDKRFQRWEASYQIFKENPFLGVGYTKIEEIRNNKYKQFGFNQAARQDLNAHNQLLEYLSRNGALGGFVYIISVFFLFLYSIYRKDYLFTFVFFAFILANLTESMMVRIKGIEYFAIFTSLFLCHNLKPELKSVSSYIKKV